MKRIDAIRSLTSQNAAINMRLIVNDRGYSIGDLINLYDYLNYDDDSITYTSDTERNFSEN